MSPWLCSLKQDACPSHPDSCEMPADYRVNMAVEKAGGGGEGVEREEGGGVSRLHIYVS